LSSAVALFLIFRRLNDHVRTCPVLSERSLVASIRSPPSISIELAAVPPSPSAAPPCAAPLSLLCPRLRPQLSDLAACELPLLRPQLSLRDAWELTRSRPP